MPPSAAQNILVFEFDKTEPMMYTHDRIHHYTVAWKMLDNAKCLQVLEKLAHTEFSYHLDEALKNQKKLFMRNDYTDPVTGKKMPAADISSDQWRRHYYFTDNKPSNTGPLDMSIIHIAENKRVHSYQRIEKNNMSEPQNDYSICRQLTREIFGEQVDDFMTHFGFKLCAAPKLENK